MSQSAMLRLMTLLSPSFPVGGFAYSSGLEQAVADGLVTGSETLGNWLRPVVESGAVWNDAVLLAQSHRQAAANVSFGETATLAEGLAGSQERHLEQQNLGSAFIDAVKASGLAMPAEIGEQVPYPVAVGAIAAAQGLELESALGAFVHAFVSNQIQCAIRLGVTGQNGGVALLAAMEPVILEAAKCASLSTLEDLGTSTLMADVSSMRHETLYSRIFRT
ncbi:MAG: urease accessory protein UreF [Rhizobiaceae bacterium]